MTLKEVIDNSLLRAIPDQKTTQQNIDFLQNIASKLEKDNQQKMQTVIDGLKKTDLYLKSKQEEEKKNQVKQPQANIETQAQVSNTITNTAQGTNTNTTAQISKK